jgi:endonuclease G
VQFSYASPSGVRSTKNLNRVRYQTNTEGGSSGSPAFNRDWRVVALHHGAGPTSMPGEFNLRTSDFNQGIPISAIVTELKKQLAGRPELAELGLT